MSLSPQQATLFDKRASERYTFISRNCDQRWGRPSCRSKNPNTAHQAGYTKEERGLHEEEDWTNQIIIPTGNSMTIERRRYIRPESLNLLDYFVVDEQGRQGDYSMARTLNISKGGMLMETHLSLSRGQQVMITLGLEDQLIEVMGRIVSATAASGRHQYGIEFFHVSDRDKRILDNYVAAFHSLYASDTAKHPSPPAGY